MPDTCRIIALANQKGGVGKTTTAINLGAALAKSGRRVLLVDMDPQGNASTGLGLSAGDRRSTTYDLLLGDDPAAEGIHGTQVYGLDIIPATTDLSSADVDLMSSGGRSRVLQRRMTELLADRQDYDYVLIDCPPALNLLTINAMVAAKSIIVPLQSEFFALEGLSQLMLTLREVRASANDALRIEGIVLTMYDRRNNLSQQVESDARETLGDLVFRTVIPRNVRLSEAPSHAMPVLDYDPGCAGAKAYLDLAAEVIQREG
ncbi:ParA family protein [Limimaricola hongkongensis]|uniref:Chromosome partitioning protein ParA n=1 Tax=Limimaricola hongkongensis DSM 17492 TaxID=1122180 RepID=A0A017HFT1_9RHOB|nr:ParA family protein [Limimaricola hongkongensis]EYD73160.1 Chromosome (plasmid) partitioning protein ParA / Sporulation initiation inhibitor protein Soj [Limimaricola hongkongensis DSM 17492]